MLQILGLILGGHASFFSGYNAFAEGRAPSGYVAGTDGHGRATATDWPAYGGDAGGTRYVSATQIDKTNVARLKLAWTFHTGDLSDRVDKPSSVFECTPIYVDGTLYVVSPFNRVFALDPDTGNAKWTYDPKIPRQRPEAVEPFACRGVSTWKNPATGRRTIFIASYDARLIALNAATGRPISSFGQAGQVDLREGVGKRYLTHYVESSAPCVIGRLLIVGSSIGDNVAVDMPSGVVRAFDAESGRPVWSWDPIAGLPPVTSSTPGAERAYVDEAGGSLRTGAGNAWATFSADPTLGLVFIPTGSASPDFFGILRPGDDRDANSVVALDAATGKKRWSFQTVHHDLWDYDDAAQPILADVAGRRAVIVLTKMGYVFVLDRLTGEPILPVEERPVPSGGVDGEPLSPTQPFPVLPKPLVTDHFEPWAVADAARDLIARRIRGAREGSIFTPPTLQGTIIFPGNLGGCNWSGGSFDPASNTLYVNTNSQANLVYLIPRAQFGKATFDFRGHEVTPELGTPYGIRRETIQAPGGIPGNRPPWGMLHAIDLGSGQARWDVPLGFMPNYRELPKARDWGSPNLGGSFVTASGLVFIAASMDSNLRAFDAATGKVLWEYELPAGGQATPMSFISRPSGHQYIIQCAGGHHGLGAPEGDSVVAFRL